jgi:hypothetical protein
MTAAEIQEILDAIKAAILVVASGGKSYTLNDGQGIMSVTRTTMTELNTSYDFWNNKLSELTEGGSFVSLRSNRR